MREEIIDIKEGIKFHKIQTNKFKTNLFAIFLNTPISKENVTKNALLTSVLRRGTKELPSQELISKTLENMYGAGFDCGIEKSGDYHTIKFYLEVINDEFLPKKEDLSKKALELLLSIVFDPFEENETFKEEYLEQEKENLKQIIEGKIDNKSTYAFERCIEEMYKGKPYGLYKYGYIEDLEKITSKELYKYYLELIQNCKIDIFASGELDEKITNFIKNDKNINKLEARKFDYDIEDKKEEVKEPKIINDSLEVTQGKLVIGLDVLSDEENVSYITMVYNTILGVGANSKLFQNVREKASLAYTCGSNYMKRKKIILIRAGIEIENYEKAMEIIKEQLENIKNGKFTDEEIKNAKNLIFANINNIEEEQDTEITYYLGQELAKCNITIDEYRQKIEQVSKEEILKIANSIKINTIYFLKD
ncbi:MAG: insulinase family protein [Clostridiaceae bacterium]|nr:insulinase family protein [Clostridiaceae bacterium]